MRTHTCMSETYLPTATAAEYLGVTPRTLVNRVRDGLLTRYTFDPDRRVSYYRRDELDALRMPNTAA